MGRQTKKSINKLKTKWKNFQSKRINFKNKNLCIALIKINKN